ncbi:glycoside hydrolase family 16 protein [Gordonia sp. VNQ95]|uniref:glycoside hydrolase family 16 protein n=1 Tax=Gordonia TaxID=2053 RepID=UPI0032B46987
MVIGVAASAMISNGCTIGDGHGLHNAARTTCLSDRGPDGSGATPETVDRALWKRTFLDTFDRCDLGDQWGTYSGSPGGNPVGHWDESMVSVDAGVMRLSGKKTPSGWVTGGVSNYPVTQTYGRWEIRMRATPSADLSYHMLLWPKSDEWPPEIDFAESIASRRDAISAFVHWKDDGENRKSQADATGDFADWHVVGVEWLPGLIRYLLDGKVWAEVRSAEMVPTIPMWLGMQVEAGACERRADWGMTPCAAGEPRPVTAEVDIDWVTVYAPVDDVAAFTRAGYLRPTRGAIQLRDR